MWALLCSMVPTIYFILANLVFYVFNINTIWVFMKHICSFMLTWVFRMLLVSLKKHYDRSRSAMQTWLYRDLFFFFFFKYFCHTNTSTVVSFSNLPDFCLDSPWKHTASLCMRQLHCPLKLQRVLSPSQTLQQ